eukprot:SM000249S08247  [mRNA]  locus=s249:129967:137876:+ [translate_table: standard]
MPRGTVQEDWPVLAQAAAWPMSRCQSGGSAGGGPGGRGAGHPPIPAPAIVSAKPPSPRPDQRRAAVTAPSSEREAAEVARRFERAALEALPGTPAAPGSGI